MWDSLKNIGKYITKNNLFSGVSLFRLLLLCCCVLICRKVRSGKLFGELLKDWQALGSGCWTNDCRCTEKWLFYASKFDKWESIWRSWLVLSRKPWLNSVTEKSPACKRKCLLSNQLLMQFFLQKLPTDDGVFKGCVSSYDYIKFSMKMWFL